MSQHSAAPPQPTAVPPQFGGAELGVAVGDELGILLGSADGKLDGSELAIALGSALGILLGDADGILDG